MEKPVRGTTRLIERVPESKLWKKNLLEGTVTLPAMKDLHTHPVGYSIVRKCGGVDVSGCSTTSQLKEALGGNKGSGLIVGLELNWRKFPGITRKDLDEVSKEDIVIFIDSSFHGGVVNSKTAAILSERAKGKMVKGWIDGEGKWREGYNDLCLELIGEKMDRGVAVEGLLEWLRDARAWGVDELHELCIGGVPGIEILLEAKGKWGEGFPITKAYTTMYVLAELADRPELLERMEAEMPMGLKLFMDGAFTPGTAALMEPYCGTANSGYLATDLEDLGSIVPMLAGKTGRMVEDIAMHAIGDRGIRQAIVMAGALHALTGRKSRLEHCTLSGEEDILAGMERLNKRGILTVVANPNFIDDAVVFAKELGDRVKRILPTRSMVERGLVSGIGTDGGPAAIWRALYDAVNHPRVAERLSLEQIVKLASGVERIEDAKHTVTISGPLVETIFFGGEFDNSGTVEMLGIMA